MGFSIKARNKFYAYLLFIIWPFFALLLAFKDYKATYAKNIFWFFCGFWGYIMVIPGDGADAHYFRKKLLTYNQLDIDIISFILKVYDGSLDRGDYFEPLITFITSKFTTDFHVLFAIFGLTLGFFYSRNIAMLIRLGELKNKLFSWPIFLFIIFVIPIWYINMFRFWTAAHIFLYGILKFISTNRKGYLIFSFSTFLVHLSFTLPVGLLIGYLFFHKLRLIMILILIGSIFFSNMSISDIVEFVPQTYESLDERIASYTAKELVQQRSKQIEEGAWFLRWRLSILSYVIYINIITIYVFLRKYFNKSRLEIIYYFSALLLSISLIAGNIPGVERFLIVSFFLFATFFYLFIQRVKNNFWIRFLTLSLILPMVIFIIIEIRIGLGFMGPTMLMSNVITSLFFEHSVSFLDIIKGGRN